MAAGIGLIMSETENAARIQVYCRIRPWNVGPDGRPASGADITTSSDIFQVTGNEVSVPSLASRVSNPTTQPGTQRRVFRYDHIFPGTADQEQIYHGSARDVVDFVLQGYNGTVLTYGQTGAGKTHTVSGGKLNSYRDRGLIARAIEHVFQEVRRRNAEDSIGVQLSCLEIYNEQMYDLLQLQDSQQPERFSTGPAGQAQQSVARGAQTLSVSEAPGGSTYVRGLSAPLVASEEEAMNVVFEAHSNRAIAEHQMNASSSRSHVVFTIHLTIRPRGGAGDGAGAPLRPQTVSKLNIVDLAGSERVDVTGSVGALRKEAAHINKSLTFLEQVTVALADKKREHIPYRQSKLTQVLKDSLGGNCRTALIACVWQNAEHLPQTLSTLKFASRMMCIDNAPVVNATQDASAECESLRKQVKLLQEELAMQSALAQGRQRAPGGAAGGAGGDAPARAGGAAEVGGEWRHAIQHDVAKFVLDASQELEVVSVAQIRRALGLLRELVWAALARSKEEYPDGPASLMASFLSSFKDQAERERDVTVGALHRSSFNEAQYKQMLQRAAAGKKSAADGNRVGRRKSSLDNTAPISKREATVEAAPSNAAPTGSSQSPPTVNLPPAQQTVEDTNQLLQRYTEGSGKRLHQDVLDAKATLKEAKAQIKQLTDSINKAKSEIDVLTQQLCEPQLAAPPAPPGPGGAGEGSNSAPAELMQELKSVKAVYRVWFEQLTAKRTELQFLQHQKDQAVASFALAFSAWQGGGQRGLHVVSGDEHDGVSRTHQPHDAVT